jgi:GPH family glycoside/pentoside/hexuronide:cation symporter
MGAITGAVLACAMLVSFFGTRTARQIVAVPARVPVGRGEAIRTLASNRPFVLLMAIKIAQYMAISVINTTKLLFLLNVVGIGYMGLIHLTLVQNIVSALCLPLWVRLGRRIGKRPAYLLATFLLGAVYVSWYFTGPGLTLPGIWARGAVNGIAAAGTTLMSIAMLPDVMEYDRLRTGVRREGIFASFYSIVEKLGYALGAGLSGTILALAGYISTTGGKLVVQPASAIAGLYAGASLIPAALITISFLVMLAYPLDEKMLRATRLLPRAG